MAKKKPAFVEKVTYVGPSGMVTEPGTESLLLLLLNATTAPPESAADVSVTVQVVPAPGART